MIRVRALAVASHPGPSLAITAMVSLLAAEAAPHGTGPVLAILAMLAMQLSIGWSNDAFDARRDAAAERDDKPVAAGRIGIHAVWAAAGLAAAATLALSLAVGTDLFLVAVAMTAAGWAYNAGLKSTLASGLMYVAGFGLIPAYAAATLPGHPWPRWPVTLAAAVLGLGAHFANVLPDLAADRATGVRGLPQRVAQAAALRAARRRAKDPPGPHKRGAQDAGTAAVRACALTLLLAASAVLLVAARPAARPVAGAGLAVAAVLAVIGARGGGRLPFIAAIGIAAVDVVMFAIGGEALT
jgi:hypothetical protein